MAIYRGLPLGTLLVTAALAASAQPGADFIVHRVATGLARPVYVTAPAGDTERLFVVEQHTGDIRILDLTDESRESTPFLTVGGVSQGREQGLLGLAFHPDYASNGLLYVNFNANFTGTNRTWIRRYQVSANPDVADPHSATPVLSFRQPYSNHNGGWTGFGPDGYLYVATGDGGGGGDPDNHAQTITGDLLGKILRIDVNSDDFPADDDRNYAIPSGNPFVGTTGDDEIWAYGLRNPWRCSFDRLVGDFYIGDVGQSSFEEIDFHPAASDGGDNFGWRLREGKAAYNGGERPPGNVDPIHDYPRGDGWSVTGGYVYRGPVPSIQGEYFFADYGSDNVWSLRHDGMAATEVTEWTDVLEPDAGRLANISSFGEDAVGNLYLVSLDGAVFRLSLDSDGDGAADDEDNCVLAANGPRLPDAGGQVQLDTDDDGYGNRCDADLDGNGIVNTLDLGRFKQVFLTADAASDFNGDGIVNTLDLGLLKQLFLKAPGPSALAP